MVDFKTGGGGLRRATVLVTKHAQDDGIIMFSIGVSPSVDTNEVAIWHLLLASGRESELLAGI